MSQENVEAICAGVDALNRGDIEAAMDLVHPEIEWETELIGTPTYRGSEAGPSRRDEGMGFVLSQMEPVELLGGRERSGLHGRHSSERSRITTMWRSGFPTSAPARYSPF